MKPQLPVTLRGTTRRFKGDGRRLGYPTANLTVSTDLTDGVYFGYADLGQHKDQPALIFVGTPVTTGDVGRRVEAHILDLPDQDYYDLPLELRVEHFHRPNQKFASLEELIKAMRSDEATGRRWFKLHTLA